jgi:tRNA pseudouridine55 synthase
MLRAISTPPLAARAKTMPAEGALHGWIVVDKPLGLSSNRVVEAIRRATAAKAGHAGTLDPWATGVLPIALGEATKTVAYAMNDWKSYRFRIRWGVARTTDDREGVVLSECGARPDRQTVEAALPRFIGTVLQSPPPYSAIKVNGERAYALSRAARPPVLPARTVQITAFRLLGMPDCDHADFEANVGKGTYIRALARDLAAALGTLAYVAELRRLSVGRFTEAQAISLDAVVERRQSLVQSGYVLPIESALDELPALDLTSVEAARLCCGQRVILQDPDRRADVDRLAEGAVVAAYHARTLVALAKTENGGIRPSRVIHR